MDWAGRGEHAPGIIAMLTFCGSVCIVRYYHIYNQVNVCAGFGFSNCDTENQLGAPVRKGMSGFLRAWQIYTSDYFL